MFLFFKMDLYIRIIHVFNLVIFFLWALLTNTPLLTQILFLAGFGIWNIFGTLDVRMIIHWKLCLLKWTGYKDPSNELYCDQPLSIKIFQNRSPPTEKGHFGTFHQVKITFSNSLYTKYRSCSWFSTSIKLRHLRLPEIGRVADDTWLNQFI